MIERLRAEVEPLDPREVARAALAGAFAYLVEMWLDEVVFRERTDDLVLLGGTVSQHGLSSRLLGLAAHTVNSFAVTAVYAAFVRRRLPGPAWSRGLTMLVAENTVLWPLVATFDRFHPSIRAGRLPTYNRGVPWLQSVFRHVAFGVAMGAVLGVGREEASSATDRTASINSSQSAEDVASA